MAEKLECLTYTIPEMARKLGVGRNTAYAAAKRREFKTLRIGWRIVVPKRVLDEMLSNPPDWTKEEAQP